MKTIKAAQTLIREHLAETGGMAVVATGAGLLASGFASFGGYSGDATG